jgi:hypothetical protein
VSDAERIDAKIARKEAKRIARKEAKAAGKAARKGISAERKAEFDTEQQRRSASAADWRREKTERNKAAAGYNGSRKSDRNIDNRKNGNETADEEMSARLDAAIEFIKANKKHIKAVIEDFAAVDDPRHQSYTKYSVPELLAFGLLSFMFQAESKRSANAKMSPVLLGNIQKFIAQIEKLPHADTLSNFLMETKADDIEEVKLKLIGRLIRNKVLDAFKINDALLFSIDGVHKFTRDYEWCQNASEQNVGGKLEEDKRYLAYALELSIILPGGHTLPVMTEFIDRAEYGDCGTATAKAKQDCETKAAKRLITRLRSRFPCLNIALAADGLYATGPMLHLCLEKRIDPMFTLQDKSLPSVWEEVDAHIASGMCGERPSRIYNDIDQRFLYVNDIEYEYGDDNHRIKLHVAICEEKRRTFDQKAGCVKFTSSTFAWVSLRRFSGRDVESRCNKIGRPRWNIETQNRIEKYDGYAYSHCFSHDWEAMRAYHFLMQIAYVLNMLTFLSSKLIPIVKARGFAQTILYMWLIFDGAILDYEAIRERMPVKYQIRWGI